MKSVILNKEVQQKKYPYLGISNSTGNVVLFTGYKIGTLVFLGNDESESAYDLGEHRNSWIEEGFTSFTDTIQLSN